MRPRVVSLLPAATEIVCALGLDEALVGRSHECDYPEPVGRLPVCTSSHVADGSSREIDDRVRDLVGRGLSLYDVDREALRRLRPDVVLTQDQCHVCAVTLADVEAALGEWTGAPVAVVSLSPRTLGDVWGDVRRVGEALGAPERARDLTSALAERVSEVGEKTGAPGERPGIVCLEWIDPPMAAGHWMPELVTIAGGRPVFGEVGARSPRISWEQLRSADPDVLLVVPCGFDLPRTRQELSPLTSRSDWSELTAVARGRVYLTDGNAYFNRPGPRLADSLEILAEILHPELCDFGGAGTRFERLSATA